MTEYRVIRAYDPYDLATAVNAALAAHEGWMLFGSIAVAGWRDDDDIDSITLFAQALTREGPETKP